MSIRKKRGSHSPPSCRISSRPVFSHPVPFNPIWPHSVPSFSTLSQPVTHSSIQFSPVPPSVHLVPSFPTPSNSFPLRRPDRFNSVPSYSILFRHLLSRPFLSYSVLSSSVVSCSVLSCSISSRPPPYSTVAARSFPPYPVPSFRLDFPCPIPLNLAIPPPLSIDSHHILFRFIPSLSFQSNPRPFPYYSLSTSVGHLYSRPHRSKYMKDFLRYHCKI